MGHKFKHLCLIISFSSIGLFLFGFVFFIPLGKYNNDPVFSKDAKKIAYVCYDLPLKNLFQNAILKPDGDYPFNEIFKEICIISNDGSERERITFNKIKPPNGVQKETFWRIFLPKTQTMPSLV